MQRCLKVDMRASSRKADQWRLVCVRNERDSLVGGLGRFSQFGQNRFVLLSVADAHIAPVHHYALLIQNYFCGLLLHVEIGNHVDAREDDGESQSQTFSEVQYLIGSRFPVQTDRVQVDMIGVLGVYVSEAPQLGAALRSPCGEEVEERRPTFGEEFFGGDLCR